MVGFQDVSEQHQARLDSHRVAVCPPPGEYAGNEDRWELDCDVCGYIGSGSTEVEAEEMARGHSAVRSVGSPRCDLGGYPTWDVVRAMPHDATSKGYRHVGGRLA